MEKVDLIKKIARLESLNDLLETEMSALDQLMKMVGFSCGIETVKATAQEIIRMNEEEEKAA